MFQLMILVKIINLQSARLRVICFISIGSLFLSYLLYYIHFDYASFLGLDKCLLALFFLTVGMVLRRTSFEKKMHVCAIISLPIWLFVLCQNGFVSMYEMRLNNFWFFIITGTMGSIPFFYMAKLIGDYRCLSKYSQWTVFIIGSHFILVTIFANMSSIFPYKGTILFDLLTVLFTVISLELYTPICKYLDVNFPSIMGKK